MLRAERGLAITMDTRGAEKKLSQARFLLGHLEHASREMALQPANPFHGEDAEHLEFYRAFRMTPEESWMFTSWSTVP